MVRSTKINENHFATVRVGGNYLSHHYVLDTLKLHIFLYLATLYLYHLHRIGAMTLDFQPGTF
jgi:hypothetical protein